MLDDYLLTPDKILQDITNLYKYPERTREERLTMEKALRKSESIFARYYLNDAFNDVIFEFELRDDIKIGQDFTVVSIYETKKHFFVNLALLNLLKDVRLGMIVCYIIN